MLKTSIDEGDFELNEFQRLNNQQNMPKKAMPQVMNQVQNRNMMPKMGQQPQQLNQPRMHNTIVSYPNENVKLTKQYASIGDDDSDENENWF